MFDGASRLIEKFDTSCNCANTTKLFYDDNGNLIKRIETDAATGISVGTLPGDQAYNFYNDFDALDRIITAITYSDDIAVSVQDKNFATYYLYDSRDLLRAKADSKNSGFVNYSTTLGSGVDATFNVNDLGNVAQYFYDAAARPIRTDRVLTLVGLFPPGNQIPTSSAEGTGVFDPVPVSQYTGDPDGIISTHQTWDLNSRLVTQSDDSNNVTTYFYDELNRKIETKYADNFSLIVEYDKDHNIILKTDQNGSLFTNTYDGINRKTGISVDITGTGSTNFVLPLSQEQRFQYDGLNRMTMAQDSNNAVLNDGDDIVTRFRFNYRSQLLEEEQLVSPHQTTPKVIGYEYLDEVDTATMFYPVDQGLGTATDPRVEYTYDLRDRIQDLEYFRNGGSTITESVHYEFFGYRDLERNYSNTTSLRFHDTTGNLSGYDNARREINTFHTQPGAGVLGVISYGNSYDRMNNRVSEARSIKTPLVDIISDVYIYDSAYRVRGTTTILSLLGFPLDMATYVYDGANNRIEAHEGIVNQTSGLAFASILTQMPRNDFVTVNEMNEITSTGGGTHVYDDNGNLLDESFSLGNIYRYDAFNRMRQSGNSFTQAIHTHYTYDALARRVERNAFAPIGIQPEHIFYYYDGQEVIEEYMPIAGPAPATGAPENFPFHVPTAEEEENNEAFIPADYEPTPEQLQQRSALGLDDGGGLALAAGSSDMLRRYTTRTSRIDEPLIVDDFTTGAGTGNTFFYHESSLGHIGMLTDGSGTTTHEYIKSTNGRVSIYIEGGILFLEDVTPFSLKVNKYVFAGRRYDDERREYHNRARSYDPHNSRFVNRDPLGIWGDLPQFGNPYAYVSYNSINKIDPYGLAEIFGCHVPGTGDLEWDDVLYAASDGFDDGQKIITETVSDFTGIEYELTPEVKEAEHYSSTKALSQIGVGAGFASASVIVIETIAVVAPLAQTAAVTTVECGIGTAAGGYALATEVVIPTAVTAVNSTIVLIATNPEATVATVEILSGAFMESPPAGPLQQIGAIAKEGLTFAYDYLTK